MLIPKEALWSSLFERGRKLLTEDTRTDQVAEPSGIRATLSGTAQERQSGFEQKEENADASTNHPERRRTTGSKDHDTKHDRRKKQVPVMLDTRLGERRDRPFGQSSIDFEI